MTTWYLARAAGIVALLAFTASVSLGAASSGHKRSSRVAIADRRYLVQMAHRSAAVTGLYAILVHVVLIVVDTFVDVSPTGALIPFTAGYRPVPLALGTLGVYVIVFVAVTGAARGRLASSERAARAWRPVHALAYGGWVLVMAHGIFAGTDTGTAWSTAIYVACGATVTVAVAVRLLGPDRHRNAALATARRLGPSAA